jgi:hypothetical protein
MGVRLRDLQRALAKFQVEVTEPKKGSHWHARGPNGMSYQLPCHNGLKTELDDKYIRGMCRQLDIDYDALKKEC